MEKIRRDANVAHVEPTTAAEALFLILHGLLSQNGFVCVVEQASGVPGFEPSLRGRCPRSSGASRPILTRLPLSLSHLSSSAVEIPPHVFVPSNWRTATGGESLCLLYKLRTKVRMLFTLVVRVSSDCYQCRSETHPASSGALP